VLVARTLVVLATLAFWDVHRATAQGRDFAPDNREWNGLSELFEIAAEQEIALEPVARLDLGMVQATDTLFIVSPEAELPIADLRAHMHAGGRIVLADDFGRGDSLLESFHIERARPERADSLRLRGNEELLVAEASSGHPLTEGVSALVTNHPQVIRHSDLDPIFSFGGRDAVVLAGAVGEGRLVAIADPSVLINNMLELRSNRRFAENLLSYLTSDREGHVFVLPPNGVFEGRYGQTSGHWLGDFRTLLEQLARVDIPASALRVAAAAFAGIFLVLAAGMLPRSSPYIASAMFGRAAAAGGFVGRVEWFAERPANLLDPTMVYKLELEAELSRTLGVPGPFGIDAIITRMKAKRMHKDDVEIAHALFRELFELHEDWERGTRGDVLPEARFRRIVQTGDALLHKVRKLG
jgi:hypothetical protein